MQTLIVKMGSIQVFSDLSFNMPWKTFGLENKKCFRKEIKDLETKFKQFCCEQSQKIGLTELKVKIVKK